MKKLNLDELSKFLSFVLRHSPQEIGLTLDQEGWANVDDLISQSREFGTFFDLKEIEELLAVSSKKRFSLSEDGKFIRALQGHSTPLVNINFKIGVPPEKLYHGSATRFLEAILKEGLKPMQRQFVHLSEDMPTAVSVGKRYGIPVLFEIDSKSMIDNGAVFRISENGVWLVESVGPEYINRLSDSFSAG